jgi:DNA-binding IscR family transcriptional regulator
MAEDWTFLTNHAHVLVYLSRDPGALLREVSAAVGITEGAVQRIVADLVDAGYLDRTRTGRRNSYVLRPDRPLRHPLESGGTVGAILEVVDGPDAAPAPKKKRKG